MGTMFNVEIQCRLCGNISCVSSTVNRKYCCSFESCHYSLQGGRENGVLPCTCLWRRTGLFLASAALCGFLNHSVLWRTRTQTCPFPKTSYLDFWISNWICILNSNITSNLRTAEASLGKNSDPDKHMNSTSRTQLISGLFFFFWRGVCGCGIF